MLKEYPASVPLLEAYLVISSGGAHLVVAGRVAGFMDDRCQHALITLFGEAFAAIEQPLQMLPAVEGRSDYLARLADQYSTTEHYVLQQVLDRSCLERHHSWSLYTLEAKLLQPHVSPTLIGNNIKGEREALGWTAEELAERSDLDVLEVEAFEEGSIVIFPEQLVQLAGAFGLERPESLLEEA